jgi:hypothetical protein
MFAVQNKYLSQHTLKVAIKTLEKKYSIPGPKNLNRLSKGKLLFGDKNFL